MAQIDVSDLLHDPDFVDNIQHVTRVPQINGKGENVLTECITNTVGCVQPASGKTLQRLPDALRNENVSSFWFQGTIVATAPGKYVDILIFKGTRYQVRMVFDWTNFGAGWCEGACVAQVPA